MFSRKKSDKQPVLSDISPSRQTRFEALVNAVADDLYRYACWVCKDATLAEELVQETYLRAWRALEDLRDPDAAKSWLFTIFRREYARQFERIRPKMENIEQVPEFVAVTQFKTDTESFVLRRALAELTIEYREPLVLQVIGGFSCDEIAEIMGVTKSTVMTRVFRARKKLRDRLTGVETKKVLEN